MGHESRDTQICSAPARRLSSHSEAPHAAPSARLWLGNISNQVTAPLVRAAFDGFGNVVDAAAFPARIGPLGYAIVVFDRVLALCLPAPRGSPGCLPSVTLVQNQCSRTTAGLPTGP